MDKKGFATLSILIVILIVTSMLLLLFYKPILETNRNIIKSSLISDKLVKDMNGKERIYSVLNKNMSFEGQVSYEDLDKKYIIETIDEDYEAIELHFSSHQFNGFSIYNKTPIEIVLEASPVDPEEPFSYDVELMINGKDLLDGGGLGLQISSDIIIPSNKIYDKSTEETNYGEYTLNIPQTENCTVEAMIIYDKLYHREIKLKENNLERTIFINNKNKMSIEFKQGGD